VSAITKPAPVHGGNFGGDDRLTPGDGAGGDAFGALAARPAQGQGFDIFAAVQALSRIGRVGPGLDAAPADLGVQRLRAHMHQSERLIAGQPDRHG